MTTNLNRSQSKTRDRHPADATRRSSRPSTGGDGSRSADEIRENVRGAVEKGVAAVAGAVEGVAETMEETHLAETAEQAIHQVGGTANKVVRAAKQETSNLKQAFSGEGGSSEEDEEDPIGKNDPTFSAGEGLGGGTLGGSSPYGSYARGEATQGTEASSDGSPLGESASRSVSGSLRDEDDDEDEPIGL